MAKPLWHSTRACAATRRRASAALLLTVAGLALGCEDAAGTPPTSPGNNDDTPPPQVGVCFYEAPRYNGQRTCRALDSFTTDVVNLRTESRASSLRAGNIASAMVFGKIAVALYAEEFGQGKSVVLAESVPTLPPGLTGRVGSYRLDDVNECRIDNGGCNLDDRQVCINRLDGRDCARVDVCFISGAAPEGQAKCYGPQPEVTDYPIELEGELARIEVTGPAVVRVYKDSGAQGLYFTAKASVDAPAGFQDALRSFSIGVAALDALPPRSTCRAPTGAANEKLSDTGCFVENRFTGASTMPAPELLPYELNAPAWADGADVSRWISLPTGTSGELVPATVRTSDGMLELPAGTMLWQELKLKGRRVETRLLVRQSDLSWSARTYLWGDDQRDAALTDGGEQLQVGDVRWSVPTVEQCERCHAGRAPLGIELPQLDRTTAYPRGRSGSQLDTLLYLDIMVPPPNIEDPEKARFMRRGERDDIVPNEVDPSTPGTILGTPAWSDATIEASPVTALAFDGATYVETQIPNGPTRTLAAWIYPTSSAPVDFIESVIDSDDVGLYGTGFGVNNEYIVAILDDEFWNTRSKVQLNAWQHVALTLDARTAALYVDGQLAEVHPYRQGDVTTANYYIGMSHANPLYFHGDIYDVRIFDAALGASDIQRVRDGDEIPEVPPPARPALPDPFDERAASLEKRARSWLHTNCSSCHRGGAPEAMELRFDAPLSGTNLCQKARYRCPPEAANNLDIIDPELPQQSVLLTRIQSTDPICHMPRSPSGVVDARGATLILRWIESMATNGCK